MLTCNQVVPEQDTSHSFYIQQIWQVDLYLVLLIQSQIHLIIGRVNNLLLPFLWYLVWQNQLKPKILFGSTRSSRIRQRFAMTKKLEHLVKWTSLKFLCVISHFSIWSLKRIKVYAEPLVMAKEILSLRKQIKTGAGE